MTLLDKINSDYLQARKDNNIVVKNLLGVIKGEIQNEQLRGGKVDVEAILKRMEKSLKQTNTPEALRELEVIKPYLPEEMSEGEIAIIIKSYKEQGLSNMGQMMGKFNTEHKGKADNKLVSEVIKKILV